MEISEDKIRLYTKRLMMARMKLLMKNGFYGLLLMHVKMGMSFEHETAWVVKGEKFCFNPEFLEKLNDTELEYVLMHLTFHLALKHLQRREGFNEESYDEAADIVANSNILNSYSGDEEFITLSGFGGVQPHFTPEGNEGADYTVEEVYQMVYVKEQAEAQDDSDDEDSDEKEEGQDSSGEGDGDDKEDQEESEDQGEESEKSGKKEGDTGKAKGKETGRNQSQDDSQNGSGEGDNDEHGKSSSTKGGKSPKGWDHHDKDDSEDPISDAEWVGKIESVINAIKANERWGKKAVGSIPALIERYIEEFKNPQIDWRTVLDEFVQEEVVDYSFSPPDRRFDDSPFFLPDFNDTEFTVKKILFMIDTSGSMSDAEITQCFSEIKGAIDQYNNKLEGWLGFFDAAVVDPIPFMDEEEFMIIRPQGGGGTRFDIIFEHIREKMEDDLPVSVVILTDGYAPYPEEAETMDIPVLWIITNEDVTPPWGRIARIKCQVV